MREAVVGPSARTHLTTGFGILSGGIFRDDRALSVAGLEAELRHYRPRTWVLGVHVYFGGGELSPRDGRTGVFFGLWVAPLLGIHFGDEVRTEHAGLEGSTVGGVARCDYRYTRHRYSSHVLGVEPVLWAVGEIGGGGHFVWEYDVYGDGRDARYAQTGEQRTQEDYRFRVGAKAGFVSHLGVGVAGLGAVAWGPFDLQLGVGAYVGSDGVSLFANGGVGVFWL